MPYHGSWHSAYLGLQYAPELLSPRAREALAKYGAGDAFGENGEYDYLDQIHFIPWVGINEWPPAALSQWTGEHKPRLRDNVMRRVVLRAIVQHPISALVLYAYTKPMFILSQLKSAFAEAPGWGWLWAITAGGLVGAIVLLLFDRNVDRARLARIVAISGAVVLFSTLPNLWAYASITVMGDVILTFTAFVVLVLSVALYAAIISARGHLQIWQAPGSPIA
jgi:hypothetical protein